MMPTAIAGEGYRSVGEFKISPAAAAAATTRDGGGGHMYSKQHRCLLHTAVATVVVLCLRAWFHVAAA